MSQPDTGQRSFQVGDRVHRVSFSTHAFYLLETELGLSTLEIGRRFAQQQAYAREIVGVAWAGLEAARLEKETQRKPYTLAGVCKLADQMGGVHRLSAVVLPAFLEAMPRLSQDEIERLTPREGEPVPSEEEGAGDEPGDPTERGADVTGSG